MIEDIKDLRPLLLPLTGGMDEESPVDNTAIEDAVKMTNWRLSKNGRRIQKRGGLSEEATAFGEDVYGYGTYVNSGAAFCQIAVLETEIQRKVGAAAWTNIYDWPSAAIIDHPVKVLEIQGKQYIITEKGSRVIQADGGVRQIGITAPATIPSLAAAYTSGGGSAVTESWNYANQAAMDVVWADADGTLGTSTLETSDPYATPGPEADTKYAKFSTPAGGTFLYASAKRTRTLTSDIGAVYAVNFNTYCKTLNTFKGVLSASRSGFAISIYNGTFKVKFHICRDGIFFYGKNDLPIRISTEANPLEKWIIWDVYVDGSDTKNVIVKIFRTIAGSMIQAGEITFYNPSTAYTNYVELELLNVVIGDAQEVWNDSFKIVPLNTEQAVIAGMFRYAVSFVRTGNFGCESNPIKSKIGTVAFTVAPGLNDMTIDAESSYTGQTTKTIRVKVKTAAATDIVQWSEDAEKTWSAEIAMASKVHLAYGITVDFAATTGHTAGNYWDIPCYAISVVATMQQVTLSSIPTSSDAQVTARKIYRTLSGGAEFFYLTTIHDNVTTTFVDNMADMTLGDQMEEDRDLFTAATTGSPGSYSTTIGKFSEWWDDRLWIADHIQNVIYYSAVRSGGGVPEEFSVDTRFVPIRKGNQGDVITAMIAYKDALYVFKRNDIFIVQKTALGYGVFHLNSDVGCIADGCVEAVNDFLMFPSERGPEIYDGVKVYSPDFAVAVNKTWLTIDPAGYKYMSMVHNKEFNEVWMSGPSRLSGAAAITVVWNYIKNKFYFFQFYKTPSCLVACKDSTGKRVIKMGTRDGYLDLCESGYADNTTAITATYRKGWIDMEAHGIARLLKVKYELPSSMTLTANIYVDMKVTAARTAALTGVTPATATDIDLRRVIGDKAELGQRQRWLAVEFINAQNCGGDCKVNEVYAFVKVEAIKKKVYGN